MYYLLLQLIPAILVLVVVTIAMTRSGRVWDEAVALLPAGDEDRVVRLVRVRTRAAVRAGLIGYAVLAVVAAGGVLVAAQAVRASNPQIAFGEAVSGSMGLGVLLLGAPIAVSFLLLPVVVARGAGLRAAGRELAAERVATGSGPPGSIRGADDPVAQSAHRLTAGWQGQGILGLGLAGGVCGLVFAGGLAAALFLGASVTLACSRSSKCM